MNKKMIFIYLLTFIFILSLSTFASNYSEYINRTYSNIKIKLNGNYLSPKDEDGNIVEPFIINGTTYLPIRAIADALDLNVYWDNIMNTVVLSEKSSSEKTAKYLQEKYNLPQATSSPDGVNELREKYNLPQVTPNVSIDNLNELIQKYNLQSKDTDPFFDDSVLRYNSEVIKEQMSAKGILDSSMTSSALQQNYNINTIVYVTNTGSKYHRSTCSYLRQSKIAIDKTKAIKQGYTPCSRCNP